MKFFGLHKISKGQFLLHQVLEREEKKYWKLMKN